jgi:hypothetical protein
VALQSVKSREHPERKQIKIELAKSIPLPPSTPPARPSTPPPPPPLYDPEEDDESSNTATHLQDRIGEHEDMELDDLDEPQPTSTDELTSSTTFTEEHIVQITTMAVPSPPPPPPAPSVSSLYGDADEEDSNIPIESNQEQSNDTNSMPPIVTHISETNIEEKPSKNSKRRSSKTRKKRNFHQHLNETIQFFFL